MNLRVDASTPIVETTATTRRASGTAVTSQPAAESSAPPTAVDADKDVDVQRVAKLQLAIATGELAIHPEQIATAVLASAQELLAEHKN